jgi:site-specific recombinase XerD
MNAIPPHEAVNRYLKDKSTDVTDSTLSNYQTTLNVFCDWLTEKGRVENLNELTSDEIQRFKEWRLENVQTITLKTDMTCIKGFVRFCEHIDAVPDGMNQLVRIPKPNPEDEVSDNILTRDEATEVLDYLEKHEYASLRHVIFAVLWKTEMRRSSLYALDKRDFEDGASP